MFTITINVDEMNKPVRNLLTKFIEELAECREKGNKNFTDSEIAESKKISKEVANEAQDIVPSPVEAFANTDNAHKDNSKLAETASSLHIAQSENAYKDSSENTVIFDARGIAWDERIHSSSRAKISNGTWKLRRGVDSEFVKRVEFEQDFMAKKKEAEQSQAPALIPYVQTNELREMSPCTLNPPLPITPIELFTQLMGKITTLVHEGKLPRAKALELAHARGVTDLPSLVTMPELTKIILADIDTWVANNAA